MIAERTPAEWLQVWTDYFDDADEAARVAVLRMLKERRDRYHDANAGIALLTLGHRWLTEPAA